MKSYQVADLEHIFYLRVLNQFISFFMKILLIQTAFIGDVVLATPLIEKLHQHYPVSSIDFLVRKGNEGLLIGHPYLRRVLIFDKKKGKYRKLWELRQKIRAEKYDYVINLQRFLTTGLLTALSGGKVKIGFRKNPLSFLFTHQIEHHISAEKTKNQKNNHEVYRNLALLESLTDTDFVAPKLYPSEKDFQKVKRQNPYFCMAPASVWMTKQFPARKWEELIQKLLEITPKSYQILLLGGSGDRSLCEEIQQNTDTERVEIWAGKLNLLESAALLKNAKMNFTNDSAPLHFASAMNAPITAIFCSTVPEFGFYPLSEVSHIVQTIENLPCRPCGLHGKKACPSTHFKCANISIEQMTENLHL